MVSNLMRAVHVVLGCHIVLTCSSLEQLEQFQKEHANCDVTKVRAAAELN